MKLKKIIFLALSCIHILGISQAQLIPVESRFDDTDSILFDVRSNQNIRLDQSFTFFSRDTVFIGGLKAEEKGDCKWSCKLDLDAADIISNNHYITCDIYTEGIKTVKVEVLVNDSDDWHAFSIPIKYHGYQQPHQINLQHFSFPQNVVHIKEVRIATEKSADSDHDLLVIGDLQIIRTSSKKVPFIHPLFGHDISKVSCSSSNSISRPNHPLVLLSQSSMYNSPSYGLFLKDTCFHTLKCFLKNTIDLYPFYEERRIDKETMQARYEEIANTASSVDNLLSQYGALIREYQDVHFYLNDPTPRQPGAPHYSPVKLVKLNDKIYVGSIFDHSLEELKLGDQVISKQNIPIDSVINNLCANYVGRQEVKESYAVSNALSGKKGEEIELGIVRGSDTLNITYSIDNNYKIPSNFIPKHGEFRQYNNDVGYLRMNSFDLSLWYRYQNLSEELQSMRALIFDVRGNRGGQEYTVYQMFSTLINRNAIVSHSFIHPYRNKETLCIKPNQFYNYNIPELVVLVDEFSTCAAELFAVLLKQHCNATIIGSSATAGAYAMRVPVELPNGKTIIVNSIVKTVFEDDFCIEGKGVSPDIWVWKNEVNDLVPYSDKVLKTALHFLGVTI